IREASWRPFDLECDPMLRVALFRVAEDVHILLINLHHIVSDASSRRIMFRELAESYRSSIAGKTPRLAELPIQYADFAAWHRERMQGEVYRRLLAYWKEKLAGAPELLELPIDRPRPPVPSFRGEFRRRELPSGLLAGFRELSRERKASLFITLLAAYQA